MSKESHSFSVSLAVQVGVNAAILLQHFLFLQKSGIAKDSDFREVWVKRSAKALLATYPYWYEKEVSRIISSLVDNDYLECIKRNKLSTDHTKSYRLTQKGLVEMGETFRFDNMSNRKDYMSNPSDNVSNPLDDVSNLNKVGYTSCYTSCSNVEGVDEKIHLAPARPSLQEIKPSTLEEKKFKNDLDRPAAASIEPPPPYNAYPNARTAIELKDRLREYFIACPNEWQYGVIEQARAGKWSRDKIDEAMTLFCNHQEAEGNLKRTFGQYKALLVKWMIRQNGYDQRDATASRPQIKNQDSVLPTGIAISR